MIPAFAHRPFVLTLLSLCLWVAAQPTQETGLIISGQSRADLIGIESFVKSTPANEQFQFAGANLLILNLRNARAESAKFEGSVDFWLLTGRYAASSSPSSAITSLPVSQISSVFIADLRKLYLSLFLPFADVSVGRQIISFGEGMVFSPVGVFSSVNILDLSLRKHGSDVARLRVPLGSTSGVDAIAKLTARKQEAAAAVKGYTHLAGFDLAGIGMYQAAQRQVITGITFKGDLVAGVYGELVERWGLDSGRSFAGMLGADYSIENSWVFTGEYLYNKREESRDPAAQISILQTSGPLLHHHYGFLMARYTINDLMNVSASAIADFTGQSGIGTLQYFYNVLQNADIVIYVQYYRGSDEGMLPLPSDQATYGLRFELAF